MYRDSVLLQGSTSSTFFFMTLALLDINDNSPIFQGTPYLASVNELTPVGTTVYRSVSATDLDTSANSDIDFGIVSGDNSILDGSQKFVIPTPRLCYVAISSPLDFETLNAAGQIFYILNISATDQATDVSLRKTAYTTLRIDITDGDDLGPVFVVDSCLTVNNICFHPTYTTEVVNNAVGGMLTLRPEFNQTITTNLAAQDQDTLNANIVFSVEHTIPSGYKDSFEISNIGNQGKLYTASLSQTQSINRNVIKELEIIVKVTEQTSNGRFSQATVKTTVVQANNFSPVVTSPFTAFIDENSPLGIVPTNSDGSSLLRVTVTDQDLAPDEEGQFTLTIEGTTDFIVTQDGYIKLNINNLNYETTTSYTFTVRATEVGTTNPKNGAVNVVIQVRDLNDNTPTFTSPSFQISTAEQDYSTSPQLLVTVSAIDGDSNGNSDINFSIESVTNGGSGKFYITKTSSNTGKQTAAISINGSVAQEENYVIIVKAEDSATSQIDRRSSKVPVEVDITGTGTRPPVIPASVYQLSISEGTPVGTSILTVPATDPEGSALTYVITSGNNGDFTINQNTGVVATARALNRESNPSYNIGVQVTDSTGLTDTATLQITITDINDITPAFVTQLYNFNVNEGGNPGTPVGTVNAQDGDLGVNGQFLYSIGTVSPTGSANSFTINANNGRISTVQVLNYEEQQLHTIIVLAADQGTSARTGSATVNIAVNDLQDEIPLFTQENYEASVAENVAINTLVIQVTAVDPDTVDAITYKFLGGNFADFSIANDGRITTSAILDYEATSQYIFTVTTNEGENGGVSSTATVTINVQDLNDGTPQITVNPAGTVERLENEGVGNVLSTITVTDADRPGTANSDVKISISSVISNNQGNPNSGNNLFFIDEKSPARLLLSQPFTSDSADATVYTVTITAADAGVPPLEATTTITVNVIRNNAPFFNPTLTTINVVSNQNTGTIGTFVATDNDARTEFNTLKYSLIPDNRVPNHFQVLGGGVISLTSSLLTDTSENYILNVIATDPPGLSGTGTVTISVNRNLNTPRWVLVGGQNSITVDILETKPLLESVTTLRATDGDTQAPYNTLTYTILGNTQAQSYFRGVKQGANQEFDLQLIRSPANDQSINSFTIIVTVQDGASTPLVATPNFIVTVNVLRNQQPQIDFNQTYYREYYREIREDLGINQEVLTVVASDADTRNESWQITYSIASSSAHEVNTYFNMVPTSGQINVKANLRGSETVFYNFIVLATDGSRTANAYVTIKVLRNLNSPSFTTTSYTATLLETQPIDVAISMNPSNFVVIDNDRGPPMNQVNYRLVNDLDHFQISHTGSISVRNSLITSIPKSTSYQLEIQAYDLGDPSQNSSNNAFVTITIIRNQAPTITPLTPSTYPETTTVSSTLFTVNANDPDTRNEFNQITYSIFGPSEAFTFFSINSGTGAVTLQQPFTGVSQTTFQVFVRATDNGSPPLSDTEVFILTVLRNLHLPVLNPTIYSAEIREDHQVGTGVGVTVVATDLDISTPNNLLTYSATGSSRAIQYFSVNSQTGVVSVSKPLYEDTDTSDYILTVRVTDGGYPPLQSQEVATVNIKVNRNNNPPVFTNLPTTVYVPQNSSSNYLVIDVDATDADTISPFNVIEYAIVAGIGASEFQINSSNGEIRSVNTMTRTNYYLTITATDAVGTTGIQRKSAYAVLSLTTDSNLNFSESGLTLGLIAAIICIVLIAIVIFIIIRRFPHGCGKSKETRENNVCLESINDPVTSATEETTGNDYCGNSNNSLSLGTEEIHVSIGNLNNSLTPLSEETDVKYCGNPNDSYTSPTEGGYVYFENPNNSFTSRYADFENPNNSFTPPTQKGNYNTLAEHRENHHYQALNAQSENGHLDSHSDIELYESIKCNDEQIVPETHTIKGLPVGNREYVYDYAHPPNTKPQGKRHPEGDVTHV